MPDRNKPDFIVLVGLPASGKSTFAESISLNYKHFGYPCVVHSSDAIRKELWGSEEDQQHPEIVFEEMRQRTKRSLSEGVSVVYDATNLSRKRRVGLLQDLGKDFKGKKICAVVLARPEEILRRNSARERHVPEDVIHRMLLSYQPPCFGEGFDEIHYVIEDETDGYCRSLLERMQGFDQENKHHTLDLFEHCRKVQEYVDKKTAGLDDVLHLAAFIHDVGKLYTKTYKKANGEEDGDAHYYSHQNVGAYLAAFFYAVGDSDLAKERLTNLVYHHMDPYFNHGEDFSKLGRFHDEKFIEDIKLIHEADVQAH